MKHLFDPKKCEWMNNQGFINATTERLYSQDTDRMKEYVATLTEDQRNQARNHMRTILRLKNDNH